MSAPRRLRTIASQIQGRSRGLAAAATARQRAAERRGRLHKPVIRVEPKSGHPPVTWAELIEAGLLRECRKAHVPMAELRGFIRPGPGRTYRPAKSDRSGPPE